MEVRLKKEVLGVSFDDLTREEAAQAGAALLAEDKFHYVVTPNPEFILAAGKDEEFRRVLNSADLVLADGVGVTYAAKILGRPLKGRVTGIGFAQELMARMAEDGKRLFLLGAKPGVAERAAENLQRQYPGLIVAGTHDGYFQEDGPVVEAIRASGAQIVSYGAPVLPGAMFLLAYYEVKEEGRERTAVIMGLPGCVMYAKRTIFDLVLPKIAAGVPVTRENLTRLGEGGLCLGCEVCTFPNCGFGKGV